MFCILEKDIKTFTIFQRYIRCFEENGSESAEVSLELDNRIQAEELRVHLEINHLSPNNTAAKLEWISTHGKAFRDYLNTIKLVYFVCKVTGVDPRSLNEDGFAALEETVNRERACLSSIF